MAIPKKGSRAITVDGVLYRWRVRHKPTHSQGDLGTPATFSVELHDNPGQTLHVETDLPHMVYYRASTYAITPSIARKAIEQALVKGWKPEKQGPTFELSLPIKDGSSLSCAQDIY